LGEALQVEVNPGTIERKGMRSEDRVTGQAPYAIDVNRTKAEKLICAL
jgi:hypothetical protein